MSNDEPASNSSSSSSSSRLPVDPARDFLPPPSQVRLGRRNDATAPHNLRTSPVLGKSSRAAVAAAQNEALARQAAREQLAPRHPDSSKLTSSSRRRGMASSTISQKGSERPNQVRCTISTGSVCLSLVPASFAFV
jgi:hypothetical protein